MSWAETPCVRTENEGFPIASVTLAPVMPGSIRLRASARRRDVFAPRLALFGGERASDVGGNRDRGPPQMPGGRRVGRSNPIRQLVGGMRQRDGLVPERMALVVRPRGLGLGALVHVHD